MMRQRIFFDCVILTMKKVLIFAAGRQTEVNNMEDNKAIANTAEIENQLVEGIGQLIDNARSLTYRTVNATMVCTNFEIGKIIVELLQNGKTRAEYGQSILKNASKRLTPKYGKGYSVDNLANMRKFYQVYSQQKSEKSSRIFKLSWSHYLFLSRIDDFSERSFYEIESVNNNWSLKELHRQFDSALYERLALSKDKDEVIKLSKQGQIIEKPEDLIKDPYILEFTGFPELASYSESDLEQKLFDNIQQFMLELGKGFLFYGRQVRITFDEDHYYVDLVFYNRMLKCFVLIDLKRGRLKHEDIGQMQMYVNYFDREIKLDDENKTIGLIICKDKKDMMVKYSLPEDNNQIFASKYQTILPNKEDFEKLLAN